jgi:Asp-tRNA(Asn)/Glu-tRNA(Gln) amidotransferase A subunit family amidase
VPAFRHGEREWSIGGKPVSYMNAMSYTQWFNLLGNPGAVAPVGESTQGLPIGVQIVGHPNAEELVLKVAARLEQVIGPRKPAPMMQNSSVVRLSL